MEQSSEMLAWLHRGIGADEPAAEGKIRQDSWPVVEQRADGLSAQQTRCLRQRMHPRGWQTAMICVRWNRTTACGISCCCTGMWNLPFSRPMRPEALECAALHALLDPERNPAQDKTVAEFLGVSRAAVSQRRKTWQQKLAQMKNGTGGWIRWDAMFYFLYMSPKTRTTRPRPTRARCGI